MGGPDPGRQERTSFNKRSGTIFRKAHELAALCGANVYVFIDHPRARTVYNSVENAHWPPPDEFLVDRYPDLQRLDTSTMGWSRLGFSFPTDPRGRSPNQLMACKLRMQEAGLDRSQAATQTKVSRKTGRPRKPQQRRRHINSELETMSLSRHPTRPDSQQHSESAYSGISQSLDISQPSQTCLPPSQNAPAKDTQSDDNMEGIFEPDHPRIPVMKLLNQ